LREQIDKMFTQKSRSNPGAKYPCVRHMIRIFETLTWGTLSPATSSTDVRRGWAKQVFPTW